ncbi:MAG: 1,4-dihydroxy-2-naphthoate octaprenyltransferase, partial [Planctomycetes bacterium]|nr:1,4-dihydroxy-2-naphthoate octaprenyltransferase [Planctomycetota bacterium]
MKHWLLATRPKTLAAGIIPVLVGSSLGATIASLDILIAFACLAGALGIQIGCNFANDAIDALKGTDNEQRIGPARAVASGFISSRAMLSACFIVLAISFCIGLYLSLIGGWPILALGIVSILCAYGYTGGPFPLAYIGLGDLFVFLFFGLFAVLGSGYMQIAAAELPLISSGICGLPVAWWLIAAAI